MTDQRPILFAALVMSLATSACLSRGEPPPGRQILADPTASLVAVTPLHDDGTRQVMFFRPSQIQDPELVDLWSLTLDTNGAPGRELLLSSDVAEGLELSYRPGLGGFPVDARGRLYIENVRYDPATGDMKALGQGGFPGLSPSGRRVLAQGAQQGTYTLYEVDDRTIDVEGSHVGFIGETLFYVSSDCNLMRIVEGGVPELFLAGVQTYQVAQGSLIVLQHTTAVSCYAAGLEGQLQHPVFLDTTTRVETPLPDGLQYDFFNFSPDARLVTARRYDQDSGQAEWFIFDCTNGSLESLGTNIYFSYWRPGHNELWTAAYDDSRPGLDGASVTVRVPGQGPTHTVSGAYPEGFNEDGRYWFTRSTRPDDVITSDMVGIADQPNGPRYRTVPEGSIMSLATTLGDGRLFVGSITNLDDFRATDYLLVDPRNGATDVLGLRGFIAATGKTRLLAIFNNNFERGDLTTVDFAAGRRTTVVPQFVMEAIADSRGDDPFPPNDPVVYQFRARYDSPWSGLWLTTLP